jgi:hypothetical protein
LPFERVVGEDKAMNVAGDLAIEFLLAATVQNLKTLAL